nr:hypothetical protein [Tanacetum cinerariifolium]
MKSKTTDPVSKSKVIKFISANEKEPSKSWRSTVSNVPSSSLNECRLSKLFFGTVKFGNDHVEKIIGYGDYQIGNVTISRVYYVEGLGHKLFSVGKFYYSNLEASKTKSWLWHRRLSHLNFGTINHLARHGLVRGLPKLKFEKDHLCSACAMGKSNKKPRKPKSKDTKQEKLYLLQMDLYGPMRVACVNGKKRNRMLIEAARTMLTYAKAPLFLWAEAVATACYTQNHSIIRLRHDKTPYELLHDKLPDLLFFHVFGALCYPTNDSENLRKLQPKADIDFDELTAMASEHSSSEPTLHEMAHVTISSELVPNLPSSTPVDHPAPKLIALIDEVVAPEPATLTTGSPSSTIVDQDAPSPSNSETTPETQTHVISNDIKEDNHDLDVAHMNNDPFVRIKESPKTPTFRDDPLYEYLHEDSTSQGSSSNIRQTHTPFESLGI